MVKYMMGNGKRKIHEINWEKEDLMIGLFQIITPNCSDKRIKWLQEEAAANELIKGCVESVWRDNDVVKLDCFIGLWLGIQSREDFYTYRKDVDNTAQEIVQELKLTDYEVVAYVCSAN